MDYNKIKKQLSDAVKIKSDKESSKMRKELMEVVGADLASSLAPLLAEMAGQSAGNAEAIIDKLINALKNIKIQVPDINPKIEVNVPDVNIPPIELPIINVPQPRVNVSVPNINIPELRMPTEMNVRGLVSLEGINLQNPLPVQLRDENGKPISLLNNLTQVIGGGASGARTDFFTIKGFSQSAFAELTNPDNRLKVELPTGTTGLTDAELRASSLPVEQVSGSLWSVSVKEIFGSTITTLLNGDNRIPVSVETGGSGLTDAELRASSVPVEQVSGSMWSVYVAGAGATVGATILDGDGLMKTTWLVSDITASVKSALIDSSGVQYSGSNPVPVGDAGGSLTIDGTVAVSGITNSVAASIIGSDGLAFGTSKPIPVTMVTGVSASVAANLHDSGGVGYSGSNPLPTYLVAGAGNSTISVGPTVSDAVDNGSAPIKIGGIARTANPTAVAGGDIVTLSADDLGRQLVRPVQVRDLIATAYVSKATGSTFGTETTLLASGSATFADLIMVTASNDSTAAITMDLRASTGGTVIHSITIPAGGMTGWAPPVPYPAPFVDHTWTIDLPDVTGTNVYVSGLFTKEV